ncbi:unnamed protein product [Callosobruchus maculatus]|uniref:Cytochrome P450 n=1 Tax=Callosobruchus maculatus TaxID=64391 RepID=A0A653CH16_CALMS|nr:unnamed protein product [Callosobruchus maculatus]
MAILLIICAIPIFLYILLKLWLKRRRTYWERKGLPVITLPPSAGRENGAVTTLKRYRKAKEMGLKHVGVYGPFNKPTYLPIDLEIMKHIAVKDFAYFQNHGVYVNERDDPISAGLFHLEDERWKSMRAKLTATFTSGKMKMMFPIVTKCADGLKDILEEHAKIGDPIDIKDALARFTTDIIGECAFGIECNCIKDPNTEFRQYSKRQFDFTSWRWRIRGILVAALPHSVLRFFRFKFIDPDIETFFKDLVQGMVKYRETEKKRRNDFLQLLIDLKNTGQVSEDDGTLGNPVKVGNTQHITMDQITAQCLLFFNAGFGTSSATMTFALYELATHPEYQDKLRDEIKTVLKKHDGKLTYEAVIEMEYLEKVINETLRKHPPLANSMRVCSKDYKVPGTDFTLEAGTSVIFTMQPIHMDPEYYPNPEEFNPENFSEENKAKRPPFTFMPFGEGPRMCIGMRFGKMQTKVGLITVLNNYKIALNKKTIYPMEYDPFAITLSITGKEPEQLRMAILLVICAIPLLLYILLKLWLKRRRTYWERKGLPVITLPPATVRQHSAVTTLKQYRKAKEMGLKHVGVYGHFNKPTYLPIDLEIMKHIAVKDFAYFQNHGVYVNERDDPISAGLFHLEDERWKSMRAKLTATFTSGKMKMMFPIVTKCAAGLKDILEDHAKIGDPIDIKDTLARFTTDVIGECAFGIECNCIKDPNTEFRKFGKKQFDFSTWQRRIRGMLTAAFPHSVLKFFRFKFIDPEVETFFKDLVQRMVEYREAKKVRRNDFLQLLIDLKNTGKVSEDDGTLGNPVKVGDTQHITMDQITAQCLIFFNAGFETSSSTMTFALYELATHPEYQDNLRDEIKTVLKKHDGKLTYEAVMEMDYLEKVINAGTNVVFTMQPIHMDPEYYPKPEEFNPENFSEENKAKRPPFTFMPFGEGPRICIGLRFGKMQTKVGLITVLNNYKVTLNKKTIYPIEYDPFSPILSIKGKVWLDLTKIE